MNDEYIPSEGEDHPSENETDAVEGEGESKLSHRKLLYQELDRLVTQICQHPPGLKRSRLLHQLLTKMKNSGLIWKENLPYYEDALQEQWVFFCSNLCESRTGTQYDRTRGNVITWFNYYFKRRLQNWALKVNRENNTRDDRKQISEDGTPIDRIDILPDRDRTHLLETAQLFTELQAWIETDPDRVLSRHVRGRPRSNLSSYIKRLIIWQNFHRISSRTFLLVFYPVCLSPSSMSPSLAKISRQLRILIIKGVNNGTK